MQAVTLQNNGYKIGCWLHFPDMCFVPVVSVLGETIWYLLH